MLYQKNIENVTWQDVEDFCTQNIAEGSTLDYKVDFPSSLEKTISAFANTIGGLILIGVEEDNKSKPVTPIVGIDFKRGLAERVMNIVLSNITPPIIPEIQVCPNKDETKAVVVIRVHESEETPHAIAKNKKVYLRTGNRNKPEELADVNEIEWLMNKRKKSIDLREHIYDKAQSHIWRLLKGDIRPDDGILTISLCPIFPRKPFFNPPDLNDIYQKIKVNDYLGTDYTFPLPDQHRGSLLHDGMAVFNDDVRDYYTELNIYGLYFYGQLLLHQLSRPGGESIEGIFANHLFCRIDEFLDSAAKFFEEIKYYGPLEFKVKLQLISDNSRLIAYLTSWVQDRQIGYSPDNNILYINTIPTNELVSEKDKWRLEAIQKICWAFDYNVTQEILDHYYSESKPKKP